MDALADLVDDARKPRPDKGAGAFDLTLIGRRSVHTHNSWLHNSKRLMKGADRCTVLVHPEEEAHMIAGTDMVDALVDRTRQRPAQFAPRRQRIDRQPGTSPREY
jgi:hypothetical protein